jgi:hypothetical protein
MIKSEERKKGTISVGEGRMFMQCNGAKSWSGDVVKREIRDVVKKRKEKKKINKNTQEGRKVRVNKWEKTRK